MALGALVQQLETVYNKTDQFGAYDATMKWLIEKVRNRAISAIKRKKKAIGKLEHQLLSAKRDKVESKERLQYITDYRKKIKKK